MTKISRNKLLEYIEHEEIAFQFGDGLMCITHPDGEYNDDELKQSTLQEFEEAKALIAYADTIKVVGKEDVIRDSDELGFNEFAGWATDTDLLILVNEDLLLCLPDADTRNVIYEAA